MNQRFRPLRLDGPLLGRKFSLWLRVIISSIVFVVLLSTVDLQEVAGTLAATTPIYLLIAYLLAVLDRFLMAYKWRILIKVKGIEVSPMSAASVYLKTSFLGLMVPTPISADVLRAYAVTRHNHAASDVISSIVMERVLGFLALFVFVMGSIALNVFVLDTLSLPASRI
jgi:hypothetical protein